MPEWQVKALIELQDYYVRGALRGRRPNCEVAGTPERTMDRISYGKCRGISGTSVASIGKSRLFRVSSIETANWIGLRAGARRVRHCASPIWSTKPLLNISPQRDGNGESFFAIGRQIKKALPHGTTGRDCKKTPIFGADEGCGLGRGVNNQDA